MDWNQLKEEAKKMEWEIIVGTLCDYTYEKIVTKTLSFYRDGTITCPFEYVNVDGYPSHDRVVVAEKRTPDQMLAIMKALQ